MTVHPTGIVLRDAEDFASPVAVLELSAPTRVIVSKIDLGCSCMLADASFPFEVSNQAVRIPIRVDPKLAKPGSYSYQISVRGESKVLAKTAIPYQYRPHVFTSPSRVELAEASWDVTASETEVSILLDKDVPPGECTAQVTGAWELARREQYERVVRLIVRPIRQRGALESAGELTIASHRLKRPFVVPLMAHFASPVKPLPAAITASTDVASEVRELLLLGVSAFKILDLRSSADWVVVDEVEVLSPTETLIRLKLTGLGSRFAEASLIGAVEVLGETVQLSIPIVRIK